MKNSYFSRLVLLCALLAGWNISSFAQTTTFNYTGNEQTYVVPAGVTQIGIDAVGGAGGLPYWQCGNTLQAIALGGRVQCAMAVTPGMTLYIYVGGAGGSEPCSNCNAQTGGYNGGVTGGSCAGGSGGATDIRFTASTGLSGTQVLPYDATGRKVVAGGGGGGADYYGNGGYGGGLTGGTGFVGATYGGIGGNGGTQTGPGTGVGAATAAPYLGTLGVGGTRYQYSGGGGGYWGGNSGTGIAGGAGGGSSYTDPVLCTSVVHTQGYSAATGNGICIIRVLCSNPGTIVGAAPVCVGNTITVSNPTAVGGTWVSSNPAVATINSSGNVTGVSAGTVTVTYQLSNPCGGVSATASITVLPLPGPITTTGIFGVCEGKNITLSDGGVGTWVSSNTSVAVISPSGVVTGVTAGTATISYTLTTGCAPATKQVTVYPTPSAITGITSACASGSTSILADALAGGSWTSSAPSVASIGVGSGLVTGLVAGTTNITYTSANGCITTTVFTVNPLPAAIAGTTIVCVGSTTTLTDATSGGTWTSSNPGQATIGIGSGIVTGILNGTPTITYTLAGTGCKITIPVIVNPLPAAITGSTNLCVGGTSALVNAGGGTWASSNTAIATVNTFTGLVTGVGTGTATISYTLGTGCGVSTSVLINPLPTGYTVSGGGNYCSGGTGVHVGMTYAASGINYQLFKGGVAVGPMVPGSNSGLDFGLQIATGLYTVVATNALTGCSANMLGSVTIGINPLPTANNMTGGGGFCIGSAGSPIGIDASETGVKYQLYNGTTAVGPLVNGTGLALDFGSYTTVGSYTAMAINTITGCTQAQAGSAVLSVSPSPLVYSVTGGGNYCASGSGVSIDMGGSEPGILYQLYLGGSPVGSILTGTGSSFSFGTFTTPGTYTVVASNFSGCVSNMTGSATVIINPLPSVNNVTGGGSYCAGTSGAHVGLDYGTSGINYTLYYGGIPVVTLPGSGSGLDFGAMTANGTYTVEAVNNTTGCSRMMAGSATVFVSSLPNNSFNVLGTGSYCSGSTGRNISTDGSEYGVIYQLYRGGVAIGSPIPGSIYGYGVDFGSFTVAGTYTVRATNGTTGCSVALSGNAILTAGTLPALHTVSGGGSICPGSTGVDVMINGSNVGTNYQLINGGGLMMTLSGTGSIIHFGPQVTSGVYTVVAIDGTTGCTRNMSGSATVNISVAPSINVVTGGGTYCAGGTGFHIGLDGSNPAVSYQLYNGSLLSGSPITGAGSAIDFGLKTVPGVYTVKATNLLTGCNSTMYGSATINVNPLPNLQVLTGGGNYCAGGPGKDINLINSDAGVRYQLYRGTLPVGAPVDGLSGSIGFGLNTAGNYTAKAVDTITGCISNMLGTVTVSAVSPVVYTTTGGGNYCTGASGVSMGQSGSTLGVNYQLLNGITPIGTPVAGTGSSLSFGSILTAGTYTIQATDTTLGCVANMAGSATVSINPLPAAQTVTGGGSFCDGSTGAHVGLANSVSGVNYQLMLGSAFVGSPLSGLTATPLDFGAQTAGGNYTVVATVNSTGCTNLMTGTATIVVKPTPTQYAITADNAGHYCALDSGVHVYLGSSQSGVNYQLFRGSAVLGSVVSGTGAPLDFGRYAVPGDYTVVATNPTSTCVANMAGLVNVNILALPDPHNVTGGGGICTTGGGIPVGLDGSDAGIRYWLYKDAVLADSMYGTGSAMNFVDQDRTGLYTISGSSLITGCKNNMFGNTTVFYETLLLPSVTIQSFPASGLGVWQSDSVKVYVTNGGSNPSFQWYVNGHMIAGATTAKFADHQLFNNDSVSCTVTASGPCGGLSASVYVIIKLKDVGVKSVTGNFNELSLIPNPNKGAFNLKGTVASNSTEELTVEVTNMLGQVVYTGTVTPVNGNVDTHIELGKNLTNGMYLLNLKSGTDKKVFHFVIEQ